ncbi:MAG: hypothetical protein DMF87_01925 [Acidobacteria bacterium]|nr:MAG: hypothetical protein DMF87_01925 [Acidobacteriota bacterium]
MCAGSTRSEPRSRVTILPAGFRTLGIRFVALAKGCLLIGISEVQLRVKPLRLKYLGSLHELSRLSMMR